MCTRTCMHASSSWKLCGFVIGTLVIHAPEPSEFCFAQTTMAINLEYQDYDYFFAGLANFGWIAGSGIAGGAVSGAAYNPVVGTVLAMSQVFIDTNIARSNRDFRLVCTRSLR